MYYICNKGKVEIRKLIQSGRSALVLVIPKKWIKMHRLSKGDSILVNIKLDKLILQPVSDKKEHLPTMIELNSQNEKYIEMLLYSAFLSDKEDIIIKGLNKTRIARAISILKRIPYLKIEEQSEDRLELTFIVDPKIIDIEKETYRIASSIQFYLQNLYSNEGEKDLQELYERVYLEILLVMKILKIKFLEYEKNSVFRYKQQIDSYYFLLKSCKELIILHKDKSSKKGRFYMVRMAAEYLEQLIKSMKENNIEKVLVLQEKIQYKRATILQSISKKENVNKTSESFLTNDLLKVMESLAYAYINNL